MGRIAASTASLLGAISLTTMPGAVPAAALDAESEACQGCHAISDWQINDPVTGRVAHLSIEPEAFARSSHGRVPCRSCHGWGYDQIPHRGSSEHPIYECVFCHDKDPSVGHLRLPQRKADLQASVHGETDAGSLDCHTCHDPHTFRPVNDSDDPLLRIEQSNAICLHCHGPETDGEGRFARDDAAPSHTAFPNYANHLRKVKCVVCHTTRTRGASTTGHGILRSDLSLHRCEQCHTPRSAILDAVYGPQRPDVDVAADAYVIGSTRSPRLELLSVAGFAATCLGIVLHALARAVQGLRGSSRRRRSNDA